MEISQMENRPQGFGITEVKNYGPSRIFTFCLWAGVVIVLAVGYFFLVP